MKESDKNTFQFTEGKVPESLMQQVLFQKTESNQAGASCTFYGRVREDIVEEKKVKGIDYSCNEEMGLAVANKILSETKEKFNTDSLTILHSKGNVPAGDVCFFVHCSTKHRKESFMACEYLVERIKKEVPIWGKEYFEDNTHTWKKNN